MPEVPDDRSALLAQIAEITALVTGIDPASVTPDATFAEDLDADSLSMVEVLEGASVRFGVPVSNHDAARIIRVRDLVEHVVQASQGS